MLLRLQDLKFCCGVRKGGGGGSDFRKVKEVLELIVAYYNYTLTSKLLRGLYTK